MQTSIAPAPESDTARALGLRVGLAARSGSILVASLFVPWLVFLLLLDSSTSDFAQIRALQFLYGAMIASYCIFLLIRRRLPGRTPVDLVAGALVLTYAASILLSPYRAISFDATLFLVTAVVVFYALRDMEAISVDLIIRAFLTGMIVLSLFVLLRVIDVYAAYGHLLDAVVGHASLGDVLSTSVPRTGGQHHPNVTAMLINLALPFAAALILRPRHGADRLLGGMAVLVCLPALFFTLSRGGWMGLVAGGAVFAALLFLRPIDISWVSRALERARRHKLAATVGGSVVALGVIVVAIQIWARREQLLFRHTLSLREEMVDIGLKIFSAHPILGAGPHSFGLLYESFGGQHATDAVHPHNAYVLTLIDVGIVGAALYAIGLAIVAYVLIQGLRAVDQSRRLQIIACAAALTTFLVHGLVDSPFIWQSMLLAIAVVMAIAFRLSPARIEIPRAASLAARLLVLALVPLLFAGWALRDNANASYDQSLRSLHEARFADAATEAVAAADLQPGSAAYQINAGITTALQQLETQPETPDFTSAIQHLERAIQDDPHGAIAYANLAVLQSRQGDTAAAVEAARAALARAGNDSTIATLAGTIFETAGLDDEAVAAYSIALDQDANLAEAPYWAASPQRLAIRDRAIAETNLTPCQIGRAAALYGPVEGSFDGLIQGCSALAVAEPHNVDDQVSLALLLNAAGRHDEAVAALDAARRLASDNPAVHLARGVILSGTLDVTTQRDELLQAGHDGRLLLAQTYTSAGEALPQPLADLLSSTIKEPLESPLGNLVKLRFTLGGRYFDQDLLRGAPEVQLLPGQWQELVSPFTSGIRQVLTVTGG